ncbi:putative clock-controlled protein 6 [Amylocarpus encephaloides]|uniref:Clock-controlled protein 6 n=1 Tax=Amylocarpus encephaloides TaxID=45428 RepID=A0A9P7YR31_9HELO|nr:putative clock-controlled protein 6 [Amylocarpus encephaloides]
MQYSVAAVIALAAASVSAGYHNGTVVYTTEVHTAYTTVCPAATEVTFNGVTYTATASQTLTITNCPCTVVKPVTTSSVVYCNTCAPSPAPVYPVNATTPAAPVVPTTPVGTGAAPAPTAPAASPSASPITASSAGKSFAVSGAALAGLLGVAAYIL